MSELTVPPPKPQREILRLVVGNLVVALLGALLTSSDSRSLAPWPSPGRAIFFGLLFGQASLLGIWGALGPNPWWVRLMGVLVGMRYLAMFTENELAQFPSPWPFLAFTVATTFVALPLLAVRLVNLAIHLPPSPGAPAGRIQFSIRHVLILIFCVACLISFGKWLAAHVPQGDLRVLALTIFLIHSVAFSLVAGVSVWFVLATKRPLPYGVGWIAVVVCAEVCLAMILSSYPGRIVTSVAAMTVVASLLIVRSRGYQLVPLPVGRAARTTTPSDGHGRLHSDLAAATATVSPMNPGLRFLILAQVAISLVVGVVTPWLLTLDLALATPVFVGIIFGQIGLLGILGSLGTSSGRYRLLGVVAGVGYLSLWFDLVGIRGYWWETYVIVLAATLLTTGVLLVVRGCGVRIYVATRDRPATPRIQFTLRHLLVLSCAAVCLWSLRDWLAPPLTELTVIALALATIGLLLVWPALGTRRPILPSVMLVGAVTGVGFCVAEISSLREIPIVWTTISYVEVLLANPWAIATGIEPLPNPWAITTGIEALWLVASLLVVRSCGYRLVRLPALSQGGTPCGNA